MGIGTSIKNAIKSINEKANAQANWGGDPYSGAASSYEKQVMSTSTKTNKDSNLIAEIAKEIKKASSSSESSKKTTAPVIYGGDVYSTFAAVDKVNQPTKTAAERKADRLARQTNQVQKVLEGGLYGVNVYSSGAVRGYDAGSVKIESNPVSLSPVKEEENATRKPEEVFLADARVKNLGKEVASLGGSQKLQQEAMTIFAKQMAKINKIYDPYLNQGMDKELVASKQDDLQAAKLMILENAGKKVNSGKEEKLEKMAGQMLQFGLKASLKATGMSNNLAKEAGLVAGEALLNGETEGKYGNISDNLYLQKDGSLLYVKPDGDIDEIRKNNARYNLYYGYWLERGEAEKREELSDEEFVAGLGITPLTEEERSLVEDVHDILSGAGYVFDAADLLDSLVYVFEGDFKNVALSAVAAVPIVGSGVKTITEGAGEMATKPYAKSRPSYGKTQVDDVWNNYKDPTTGKAPDPAGGSITWDKTKPRQGQWDMGHIPGEKYSDMRGRYIRGEISQKEFLEWYRNPANYRPELPSTNRSHKYE